MMAICWARIIPDRWSRALCAAGLLIGIAPVQAQPLSELARAYRAAPSAETKAPVLRYAASHSDSSGSLAYLVLGSEETEQRQFPEAVQHLEAAAKKLPAIADYVAYLTAVCRFEQRQYKEVEKELKPVWEQRSPSTPLAEKAVVVLANADLADKQPARVIALVRHHAAELTTPVADSLLGHAYLDQGDAAAALEHFRHILTDYPLSAEAADAGSDPARISGLPVQAHLTRCLKLLEGGETSRSRQELEDLLPNLTGTDRDLAQIKIGEAQFLARATQPAYDYLKGLELSSGEADAERLYYVVRCARRLEHPNDFKPALDRLAASYPRSTWRQQALRSAGDYYWVQNDVASYQPIYRSCAESFASQATADECQWRLAFSEYRQHRGSAAAFEVLLQRYPDSDRRPNSLYFLGRLAEGSSDWGAAHAWYEEIARLYPNFFYATLARKKLKQANIAGAAGSPATLAFLQSAGGAAHRRAADFAASPLSGARYERAELLASAGLDDLAESELRFGSKVDGQPEVVALELAELAGARNAPDLGIRYIKQLAPRYLRYPLDEVPEKFWRLAFPFPFREALEESSRQHGLDPFLVAALIRQESEFNPKVISHANAYGLTQVLPSTGREISRKLSLRGFRTDMLFTPEINLKIGTYFLRSLLDRLQGNWEATLASYNAGPNRVARWLTWGEFSEPAEFIETIPFDETRIYVMSVLRNADLYRRLYGPRTVALASTDGNFRPKDTGAAPGNSKPATPIPQ